jgi:hypothetical protein
MSVLAEDQAPLPSSHGTARSIETAESLDLRILTATVSHFRPERQPASHGLHGGLSIFAFRTRRPFSDA